MEVSNSSGQQAQIQRSAIVTKYLNRVATAKEQRGLEIQN